KLQDSRDADDAIYELNSKEMCGERVIVEQARGPRRDRDGYSYGSRNKYGPPVRTEFRLIVEYLSSPGEVTFADAQKERTNEGVIEFRSYSDMKRALDKLDGHDLEDGHEVEVVGAAASKGRSRSRSKGRKSRSKSKSKPKSDRGSRSCSRSRSKDMRNLEVGLVLDLVRSPKENGKGDIKSKSRSRSQSRSNSPLPAPPSKARSVSPAPK
ncbi:hypothetical protein FD754_021358, partial [Muntiacus muntjak]